MLMRFMKLKTLLITVVLSGCLSRPSAETTLGQREPWPMPEPKPEINYELIDAIIWVESKGDQHAIGDTWIDGGSVGVLQIQKVMVDDINRILKLQKSNLRFSYTDRTDVQKSIQMFEIYVQHYHGSWSDAEAIARSWKTLKPLRGHGTAGLTGT